MKNSILGLGVTSLFLANLVACGGSDSDSYGEGKGGLKNQCPAAIYCEEGSWPTDSDGDGCEDSCTDECPDTAICAAPEPKKCGLAILCAEGTYPIDSDRNGCEDTCTPECPPTAICVAPDDPVAAK